MSTAVHHERLLDSLPVVVYRAEAVAPYETIYINAAIECLGYTHEEWLERGDMWVSRLHPEDRDRVQREALEAYTRGTAMDTQYRLLAKDGGVRWFHDRGEMVFDEPSGRAIWQGIMLDITAQREAEQALRDSEARYRLTFDEAGIGMAVSHLDGRIEHVNAAMCKLVGYARSELVGKNYRDITHPDDLVFDGRNTERLAAGQITSFLEERRLVRSDGTIVWGLITIALLRDEHGAPRRRIAQVQDITERKRAELALRTSEVRNRMLVETAHEGIWTVDEAGIVTYVNARLCGMLGRAPGEILGRELFEFMTSESAANARRLFARGDHGTAEVHELALVHRDGHEVFVLMSTSPSYSETGEFRGGLAMMTDITERRHMEQALRDSEARYRHVVANAPGMVYQFVYRPDGTRGYTFVSEGARAIFGVDPEAAVRDANVLLDLLHPDDREQFLGQARAAAATGSDFDWEGRVCLPSGEERFVHIVARDQRLADGTVISDGLVLDETQQREAIHQLEQSEIRFRLAARATNDVVYDWNIPAGVHFWGETLLTAFGYDPNQFEPTYEWWLSLVHPDDAERVTTSLDAALNGNSDSWMEEYRFRRSDGTDSRVLDRGYVLRDEAGKPLRLVGSMIDLTEHQLLEEQLRQSQKMEAIGRLAGGVAHDFNNIITVIKGNTGLLLESMAITDSRRDDVRQIADAADRAAGLTRQLLAFSRKQILKPRVLSVNDVVKNLKPMLGRLIGEDIAVETQI